MQRLTDLREILRYVPHFRDKVFVIALDGAIVAESTVRLKTMSVASAVIELDTKDSPVYVFRNAGNDHVNIVYRRSDGNIGWIDTSAGSTANG